MPTISGSEKITRYSTTAGRALLSEILPRGLPFKVIDKPLKKKEISKLINESFRRCGLQGNRRVSPTS
jgi:DNA-directed RNA polymerase subunit beta'